MVSGKHTVLDSSALTGWFKSSYSGGGQGECLEVTAGYDTVPIRDSKTPSGPALVFSADGWSSFVSAVKDGNINP
ncbi:DUF397 domain-containing protein [Streptomyces sp. Ncost-T10-10d]|uniref:DUF397 domain-containing protein n=1 Tax=Streptomyces sp. Ncost-T10-10d TaxID=1839774 RepID=UPI00081E803C|nr:DUF397 domain-containing protein [Streptomyces sp. Ncost-T10-10d]SCF84547.1 protein of unknown function [Streptomyces sp. Ncost-T10-10d]